MNLHEMLKQSRLSSGTVARTNRAKIDLDSIISTAITEGHIKPSYQYAPANQ